MMDILSRGRWVNKGDDFSPILSSVAVMWAILAAARLLKVQERTVCLPDLKYSTKWCGVGPDVQVEQNPGARDYRCQTQVLGTLHWGVFAIIIQWKKKVFFLIEKVKVKAV